MQKIYLLTSALIALAASFTLLSTLASASTITKTVPFSIVDSIDNTTNNFFYTFNVSDVGTISAAIAWSGNATNLTVSLIRNATGAIANHVTDNSSTMSVSYSAVADNITAGSSWNVNIADYYPNTTASGNLTLTWNALLPSIVIFPATSITSASAILQAAINPYYLNTTYEFVNVNSSQNFAVDSGNNIFSVGPISASVNVSLNASRIVSLGTLQPNTTYSFQVTAQSDAGSASGNILSFTTLPLTTTTTTSTSSTTTSATTSETTTTAVTTETTTETVTSETVNATTTGGTFFSDVINVAIAAVIGIVIIAAILYMYVKGWNK